MMKLAPVGFLVALGIFLSAIAASQRNYVDDEMKQVPLDFTGIDSLEIRSNQNANISIQDDLAPSINHSQFTDPETGEEAKVEITRQNNTLLINAKLQGYRVIEIRVPSSVRKMVLSQATLNTSMKLEALDISLLEDSLNWTGDVKSLTVRSIESPESCKDRYCSGRISIDSGVIDQLTISTMQGEVALGRANELRATRLLLGPDVRLSLSNASSLKNIQFEEYAVKPAAEVVPEQ